MRGGFWTVSSVARVLRVPAFEVEGTIQNYAWGSHTAISDFQGRTPSDKPEAELWLGTHPRGPARVVGKGEEGGDLRAYLATDLPFLFKLLAADRPLSLQAHPNRRQAEEGFEAEEASGVPLAASIRNYRDKNHKPELICAKEEFHALSGFRPFEESLELFDALGVLSELSKLAPEWGGSDLEAAFVSLFSLAPEHLEALIGRAKQTAHALRGSSNVRAAAIAPWVSELAENHPSDPGVLAALLLNYVRLAPGQAIFLPAGNLHAYLRGVGFELMANSDNVMRGGLTPKHVDVPELCRVLDFSPLEPEILSGVETETSEGVSVRVYRTPAEEFELTRIELSLGGVTKVSGPSILLVDSGQVNIDAGDGILEIPKGRAAFVASGAPVELSGNACAFLASVPSH